MYENSFWGTCIQNCCKALAPKVPYFDPDRRPSESMIAGCCPWWSRELHSASYSTGFFQLCQQKTPVQLQRPYSEKKRKFWEWEYLDFIIGNSRHTLQRGPMSLKSWSFSSLDKRNEGLFSIVGRLAAVMVIPGLLLLLNLEIKIWVWLLFQVMKKRKCHETGSNQLTDASRFYTNQRNRFINW